MKGVRLRKQQPSPCSKARRCPRAGGASGDGDGPAAKEGVAHARGEEKREASPEATSGKLQLATSFVLGTLSRADQEELLVQWTEKLEGMYATDVTCSRWLLNWLMSDISALKALLVYSDEETTRTSEQSGRCARARVCVCVLR